MPIVFDWLSYFIFTKITNMSRLYFLVLVFVFQSCASISGFQDGKTLGKKITELESSIIYSKAPAYKSTDHASTYFPNSGLNFGLHLRSGLNDKTDIGFRLNTNLSAAVSLKRQILGDQYSHAAIATGIEVGTSPYAFGFSNFAISIPLYFSIHPEENYSMYFSPIYTAELSSLNTHHNYGVNFGLLSGSWNKTGLEFGYYKDNNNNNNIFIAAIALKFKLNKKPTLKK